MASYPTYYIAHMDSRITVGDTIKLKWRGGSTILDGIIQIRDCTGYRDSSSICQKCPTHKCAIFSRDPHSGKCLNSNLTDIEVIHRKTFRVNKVMIG
jgi:hypothetical protein